MKRYCIKCREDRAEYFDIIGENDSEYKIRLTRLRDGTERVLEETIRRDLFDICIKTGYIFEMENVEATVA